MKGYGMNLPPLPELPQPAVLTGRNSVLYVGGLPSCTHTAFTAEQVREFALSYGRAVQEACAEVAESCGALDASVVSACGITKKSSAYLQRAEMSARVAAAIRNGVIREG